MVGDQHFNAQTFGACDTIVGGDAVVDRNDERRVSALGQFDNFRCQTIAKLNTIRHQITDIEIQSRQNTHQQDRGRCTVGVEITDDDHVTRVFSMMDQNNRILVAQGLRRIRAGRVIPGIAALIAEAGRDRGRCTASDLGFAVGPRLNAAGRLEDMSIGVECLLTDNPVRARELAARLSALNKERREIEGRMR